MENRHENNSSSSTAGTPTIAGASELVAPAGQTEVKQALVTGAEANGSGKEGPISQGCSVIDGPVGGGKDSGGRGLAEDKGFLTKDRLDVSRYSNEMIRELSGAETNLSLFQSEGFTHPLVIRDKTGLGLRVPAESFDMPDIKKCVGSRRLVPVRDTNTGQLTEMSMKAWLQYYESKERWARALESHGSSGVGTSMRGVGATVGGGGGGGTSAGGSGCGALLSVSYLSLIQTKLSTYVDPPLVVHQTDWANVVCATVAAEGNALHDSSTPGYLKLQRQCSLSVAGSFEEFHVEAGGASHWFYLHKGNLLVWLIPPTPSNYSAYVSWIESKSSSLSSSLSLRSPQFLADRTADVQAVYISAGNTLVIPSGWIYGVYCVEDSVRFSGSFLHSFSVATQIKVWQLENQLRVPVSLRYPLYVPLHWYILDSYVYQLTGARHRTASTDSAALPQPTQDPDQKVGEESGVKKEGEDVKVKEGGPVDRGQESSSQVSSIHVSVHELEGIRAAVDLIEKVGLDSVPADINNPAGLLTKAKSILVAHAQDDAKLAVTGRPILEIQATKKHKDVKIHKAKRQSSLLNSTLPSSSPLPSPSTPSGAGTGGGGLSKGGAAARRRRVRCRKCEKCTSVECGDCAYCADMKKFGGQGRLKQTCIARQCSAPILPTGTVCDICKRSSEVTDPVAAGGGGSSAVTADSGGGFCTDHEIVLECGICWHIVHPSCLRAKNPGVVASGVVNEDLPNSWECPVCCEQGKRGQTKPRITKGHSMSRGRAGGGEEGDYEEEGDEDAEGLSEADGGSESDEQEALQPSGSSGATGGNKNKNKSLIENKSLLNCPAAESGKRVLGEDMEEGLSSSASRQDYPSPSSRHSQPNPSSSSSSIDPARRVGDTSVGVHFPPTPPRVTIGPYVVRPLPCPPPPKHVTMTTGSAHALDRDQWLKVFEWLPRRDLCICMCVCKTWNRWAYDQRLWPEISLRGKQVRQQHLIGIVRHQPRSLDLSSTNISYRQLYWLLARLPHLKHLNLSNNSWAAVSALSSPIVCPPSLLTLDLSWVAGLADPSLIELVSPPASRGAAVRPGVQDASISRLHRCITLRLVGLDITDEALLVVGRHMTRLECVDLRLCAGVGDAGVKAICSGAGDRLQELVLTGCVKITGAILEALGRLCANIRQLSIECCALIGEDQRAEFVRRHANCTVSVVRRVRAPLTN